MHVDPYYYGTSGVIYATNTNAWWFDSQTTGVIRNQPTEWDRAALKAKAKAEPEDEFTWLRRRVAEVEEMAFA